MAVLEVVVPLFQVFTVLFISGVIFVYIFLRLTTSREPNLYRANSEKTFFNPQNGVKEPFPSITDTPTLYISLVVPAYKEQDRLPPMMEETMQYLQKRKSEDDTFTYEIIIVNDGSSDRTKEVAMSFVTKYGTDVIRLLDFEKNRGKGGAVRMGCLSARGKMILFLDADGATDIKDLIKLERAVAEIAPNYNTPAVICGSRAHLEEEAVANRSFFRNFLMYGFHFLVYGLCVRGIRDTQCGFKLCTRSAADVLFNNLHIERWAFDVELLYIAQTLNMPIKEVAVNWQEIDGSKMIPIFSWLQMGRDLLFIRLRYMFRLWKIKTKTS